MNTAIHPGKRWTVWERNRRKNREEKNREKETTTMRRRSTIRNSPAHSWNFEWKPDLHSTAVLYMYGNIWFGGMSLCIFFLVILLNSAIRELRRQHDLVRISGIGKQIIRRDARNR